MPRKNPIPKGWRDVPSDSQARVVRKAIDWYRYEDTILECGKASVEACFRRGWIYARRGKIKRTSTGMLAYRRWLGIRP